MARLLRLHFASVGVEFARFAPLTLDFRSPDGPGMRGANSVLWLRNGGGRSSILNLFFSLIIPNRRDFLGETADGRNQRFSSYIKDRDLSFVVAEWHTGNVSQQDFVGGKAEFRTWVTGQMLHWPPGATTQDDSNLKRMFFAFRTGQGLELESLPVQGLGTPAVDSPRGFRDWISSQKEAHPSAECYTTEKQSDWEKALTENMQLDPELFRLQLEMNRAEGGADRVLRFKTSGEFAQFIFKVSASPDAGRRLRDKLSELRTKQEERPARQMEQRFVVAMLEPLAAVEVEAAKLVECESAISASAMQLAGLRRSIADRTAQLGAEEKAANEAARRALGEAEMHAKEGVQYQRLSAWYHRQGLTRAVAEAEDKAKEARGAFDAADRASKAAEAARKWLRLRATSNDLASRREARRQAQLERQPQLEALTVAAGAFRGALQRSIHAAKEALAEMHANETRNAESLRLTQEQLRGVQAATGEVKSAIGAYNAKIAARDSAWRGLAAAKVVAATEDANDALVRRKDEVERLAREQTELADRIASLEERARELDHQERQLETSLARLEEKLTVERARFIRACAERDRIDNDVLRHEFGPDSLGALDEALATTILAAIQREELRIIELTIEGLEDRRADDHLNRTDLLPPPMAVQDAIAWLAKEGIPSQPASQYLAGQQLDESELRALIASDPARFSGVVILTDELMHRLDRTPAPPHLAQPVVVALPTLDRDADRAGRKTLLPGTIGAYSKEAASVEREHLQRRILGRDARIKEAGGRRDKLREFHEAVIRFQREWQGGRLEELGRQVDALGAEQTNLATKREATVRDRADITTQSSNAKSLHAQAIEALTQARRFLDRLEQFHREHESLLASHRTRLAELTTKQAALDLDLERLEGLAQELRGDGERLRTLLRDQGAALQKLGDELAAIPSVYLMDEVPAATTSLEVTRLDYEQRKRTYEDNPAVDRLNGEIDQLEKEERSHQTAFSSAAGNLSEPEWRRFADDPLPEVAMADVSAARDKAHAAVALTGQELERSRRALLGEERKSPVPAQPSGAKVHATATEWNNASVDAAESARECQLQHDAARQTERAARLQATQMAAEQRVLKSIAKRLERVAEVAPPDPLPHLPEATTEIESIVDQAITSHDAAENLRSAIRTSLNKRIASARRVADDKTFAEMRDALRSWIRVEDDEVVAGIGRKIADLRMRLEALRVELETFDADRRVVLAEFEQFARESSRHLQSIEKVSLLPPGLGDWSGQKFLEVRLPGMAPTPEERQARLVPLLDELTAPGADLPAPDLLAVRSVEALLGTARHLDIQLIKPHALGTVQRFPVGMLGSFSDGERLTASVLIYCTLARLRARNRGQQGDAPDAGVLILDNPIGKCSHHGLIELQQRVARSLNVQLVYTTGIEDLGALASFPRVIRLTNNTRSSKSGDLHVRTEESLLSASGISIRLPEPGP